MESPQDVQARQGMQDAVDVWMAIGVVAIVAALIIFTRA